MERMPTKAQVLDFLKKIRRLQSILQDWDSESESAPYSVGFESKISEFPKLATMMRKYRNKTAWGKDEIKILTHSMLGVIQSCFEDGIPLEISKAKLDDCMTMIREKVERLRKKMEKKFKIGKSVPVGGAVETEIALSFSNKAKECTELTSKRTTSLSLFRLLESVKIYTKLSDSFKEIPKALAKKTEIHPIQTVYRLERLHSDNLPEYGICMEHQSLCNMVHAKKYIPEDYYIQAVQDVFNCVQEAAKLE